MIPVLGLVPFTHRLPPLLARDPPSSPPLPSPPAHKALDSKYRAHTQPLSLDSRRGALKRDSSGEAHQGEAPNNRQRVGSSGDTDDAGPCPTSLSTIVDIPQPPVSDVWQPHAPKDDSSAYDSGYSSGKDDATGTQSDSPQRSARGDYDSASSSTTTPRVIFSAATSEPAQVSSGHQSSANGSAGTARQLPPSWPASPPPFSTSQAAHMAPA